MPSDSRSDPVTLGSVARSLGLAVLAGVLVQLARFYFALAWFGLLPWVAGGIVLLVIVPLVVVGRDDSVPMPRLLLSVLLTLAVYVAVLGWTQRAWFDQKTYVVIPMVWEERAPTRSSDEPEVSLRFVDAPSYFVALASRDLVQRLQEESADTVLVQIRITRDLGCLRGTSVRRVDGLTIAGAPHRYSGRVQAAIVARSPWGADPFWCP